MTVLLFEKFNIKTHITNLVYLKKFLFKRSSRGPNSLLKLSLSKMQTVT